MIRATSPFTHVLHRLQRLLDRRTSPSRYTAPIAHDDLTGEYLLIEVPESPSPDAEAAVQRLLTETHRNGFTVELTDSEGYPSLFPPGATFSFSLSDSDEPTGRLGDLLSSIDRFRYVFSHSETDVIVLNAARIEENIRIAEHDPGKSGRIARGNLDALADCLSTLPETRSRFVNGEDVPSTTRDSYLIEFKEALAY